VPLKEAASISGLLQSFSSPNFSFNSSTNDRRPVMGDSIKDPRRALNPELQRYMNQLNINSTLISGASNNDPRSNELKTAPLFSWSAKEAVLSRHQLKFPQYALLGHLVPEGTARECEIDPIFINTDSPWSAFICGSQGSGKSYTLSCMLEGCLLQDDRIGILPQPLTGIVFNYDSQAAAACEAAYLCSAGIKVTVLVSPSNFTKMERLYKALPSSHNLQVKPLFLKPSHLNTERMKRLMACGDKDTSPPLYMQVS
jgi:hypothetical protein